MCRPRPTTSTYLPPTPYRRVNERIHAELEAEIRKASGRSRIGSGRPDTDLAPPPVPPVASFPAPYIMIQEGSPPTAGQLSRKGSGSIRATSGPQSKRPTKVEEVNNTDRSSKLSVSSDPAENPNAFSSNDMRSMFDGGATTSRDARKEIRNANRAERSKGHKRAVDSTMSIEWEAPTAWPPPGNDFVDLPHRKTIFDVPERPKYSAAPQGRWIVGRDDHWKFACAPDRYNLGDDGGTAVAPRRSGKTLDWEQVSNRCHDLYHLYNVRPHSTVKRSSHPRPHSRPRLARTLARACR